MPFDLIATLSYVLISTFTPGPSNISTASNAVLHGYKRTLAYQFGLALGVFSMMLLSGLISTTLLAIFPALEPVLRSVGAAYILYLAYGILRASYHFTDEEPKALGIGHGFLLNALNPKLVVYAFTLFSGFLTPIMKHPGTIVLAALLLAAISFAATSLWAVFGTAIQRYLKAPKLKLGVNILLALALVYTAVALSGLLRFN